MDIIELNIKHLECQSNRLFTLDDLSIDPSTGQLTYYTGITRFIVNIGTNFTFLYNGKIVFFKEVAYFCTTSKIPLKLCGITALRGCTRFSPI